MRASTITKALVAAVSNGIATTQSLAGAGKLTLNGSKVVAGVAILDSQRQVIITSAGDDSGLTWVVIGTDDGGNAIKDSFAGANGAATSNLSFKTVTSINGSAATASTVTSGTNGVGSSPWKLFSDTIPTPNMSFDAEVGAGTVNYTVEYTQQPFLAPIPPNGCSPSIANAPASPNPVVLPFDGLTGLAVSAQAAFGFVFHAWRLTINSGTDPVTCTGRQSGLASP